MAILVLGGYYFQAIKIMTMSIVIIWQKVDASVTFYEFLKKLLHFRLLSALKHQSRFSVTVFRSLPRPYTFIDSRNIY